MPHIPLAKERLDVGPAVFGLALLAFAGGAVWPCPPAGMLINRFGSARMTSITGILFCLTFFGPILAPAHDHIRGGGLPDGDVDRQHGCGHERPRHRGGEGAEAAHHVDVPWRLQSWRHDRRLPRRAAAPPLRRAAAGGDDGRSVPGDAAHRDAIPASRFRRPGAFRAPISPGRPGPPSASGCCVSWRS